MSGAQRSRKYETSEGGITAEGLTRRYGDFLAVDDVSFEVPSGEVFGLLGPNGAGKTTLIRMLAGILVPTAGRAELLGIDVNEAPIAAKAKLGFLSGDTRLYGRLTVRETLAYFAALYRLGAEETERRIGTVMGDFDLVRLADQRCDSLSTGQNQRVNLARAFLSDPPVLILDEPTVGLDVISGRFVIEAIDRARSSNKAVLFSSHVMSEVEEVCDRVGLLVAGRLRAVGTKEELVQEWQTPSLGDLLRKLYEERAADAT